jgi:4-hydroxybenzoate polyprenyltransferase
MNRIQNWSIYLKERSPLHILLVLSFLGSASALSFSGIWHWGWVAMGTIGIMLLLIQLRLADEVKDEEKDRVVNPTRPLPRGLLTSTELIRAMYGLIAILLGLAWWIGSVWLAVATLYGWLMYREFFIGPTLNRFPFAYAVSHQAIVFPIYAWLALHSDGGLSHDPAFQGWLLAQFGASFAFEIARKRNPDAHPMAGTYLQQFGEAKTTAMLLCFAILAGLGSFLAGTAWLAAVPVIGLTTSAWIGHKSVESWAALSSLAVSAGPALMWLITTWR